MARRSITVATIVVLALLLASCRTEDNSVPPVEQQDRILQTATLIDESTLRVTWDPAPCETFNEVQVDLNEDFVNIRIRVSVDIGNCPPGGFTEATVDIGEPIGERRIWDLAFGDTVLLER